MQTAFIRHKFEKNILADLWESQLIAIQFKNISSTDPKDYSGEGKNALNRMRMYCNEGALIGATYRGLYPSKMILGTIDKGSEIRIVEINGYKNKTIQLQNIKLIDLSDYPLLLAIQPPHLTTTGWPSANKILNALYYGIKLPHEVSSLNPGQLEVLCYEYLRIQKKLDHLLLPIGRTMHDIDIYGINKKNELVFVQVTQSRKKDVIDKKITTLNQFKKNSRRLFFFGPEEFLTSSEIVSYQPIEKVLSFMQENYPDFVDSLIGC